MNNNIKWALLAGVLLLAAPSLLSAKQKIVVRVNGISCAFCAYGLEKKLSELEGVEKVEINLKNGTAVLTVKEDKTITDETIKKTVKDSGFTPKEISREQSTQKEVPTMETITLSVTGMMCSGCVFNIKTALEKIPAVSDVEVDLKSGTAVVKVEKGKVTVSQLIDAVEKVGRFKASLKQSNDESNHRKE